MPSSKMGEEEIKRTGSSLKAKLLSRVLSENYERVKKKILDPRGPTIRRWKKIFLVACLISVFFDPLFLLLPVVRDGLCIEMEITVQVVLTVIRSVADLFYIIQIFVRFRTAYVAPPSRVLGSGELVIDSSKIARRYLRNEFWIDFFVALPVPQVLIWVVIPNLSGSAMSTTGILLRLVFFFQYVPRILLVFPLSSEIVTATFVEPETAWAGAAYNLMLFHLVSHVLGACWYLLSIKRLEACWKNICRSEESCQYSYFDCRNVGDTGRTAWFQSSNVTTQCNPSSSNYPFGIYSDAVRTNAVSALFINRYFYCLFWGLHNLSCMAQNLYPTMSVGEILFSFCYGLIGVFLFALLLGNVQRYLQYITLRLEEWRIKKIDTEHWMHHRHLPQELRQPVRKYGQYKWITTRGVDEEALLKGLPVDLQRKIKGHLCYNLVRRVPLFDQMDERTLDAVCLRLKPALCTQGNFVVREGDPINYMLFIIRGNLDSYTTYGGRAGFYNSCRIGPGDFCGEELLTWALNPRPSDVLASSTRSVKAISDVEAFALSAEDLKFVAAQFRRLLKSKQLRHTLRFYSPQWRTWAACFIQVAWRRHRRRKSEVELSALESLMMKTETGDGLPDADMPDPPGSGFATYTARMSASRLCRHNLSESSSVDIISLQKPSEPDFPVDDE